MKPQQRKSPVRRVFGRLRATVGGGLCVFELTKRGLVVHKLHARKTYTATFTQVAYVAFQNNANEHKTNSPQPDQTAPSSAKTKGSKTTAKQPKKRRNNVSGDGGDGVPPIPEQGNTPGQEGGPAPASGG